MRTSRKGLLIGTFLSSVAIVGPHSGNSWGSPSPVISSFLQKELDDLRLFGWGLVRQGLGSRYSSLARPSLKRATKLEL